MMRSLPLSAIAVPKNRQRTTVDEPRIRELRQSFRSVGQLSPICVRRIVEGQYELIAGERRIRARQNMDGEIIRCGHLPVPAGEIAAVLWDDLSPLQQYEMELEENIRRVNLSWQDECQAVNRLSVLRTQQAAVTGEHYNTQKLAAEVGIAGTPPEAAAKANAMVVVAKHLDDPDVASAKSLKEAQKVVDKKVKAKQLGQLASAFEARAAKESPHRLIRGDAFAVMAALPEASFDCIVTDPPYGIGAHDFGDMAKEGHEYADDEDVFKRFLGEAPAAFARILTAQAHVYVFCDHRRFEELRLEFELEGFDVWPWPIIWTKGNGMLPKPTLGPRRTYECILFANKGARPVEYVASDVISASAVGTLRHGAEKPISVFRDLLGRSTRPGSRVLDPFCGSGTIFPAASLAKVAATGIEVVDKYADLAASRMLEEVPGSILDLF